MSEREREHLSTADIASASHDIEESPREEEHPRNMEAHPNEMQAQVERKSAVATDIEAGEHTQPAALFGPEDSEGFRRRWDEAQAGFVDNPRQAVQQADGLVAEVIQRLADTFARERANLEQQWSRGEDVSTEDLRVSLQRYRSFFDRLLSL